MNDSKDFKRSFLIKILRNTFSAAGVRIFMVIVSIFLIPFMISILGKREYGILALLGIASGYVGLLDVGFSSAFVKYISEHYTKRETVKINQIINSGFGFYILWASFIVALSYFFLRLFLHFFTIPQDLVAVTIFAFWLTIATLCINNIFQIFGTVLSGIQRIAVASFWTGIVVLIRFSGIVIILLIGWGIRGVVIINLLAVLIMAIINFILCRKLIPSMSLNLRKYFDWKTIKKLFNFGYKLQVAGISTVIFNNVDKTLIGRFCGLEWVTFYQIGAKILEKIKAIPQMFFAALLPGFSEIDALKKKTLIFETYRKSAKLLSLVFLPVLLVIVSVSGPIILLWLGPGFENAAYVMRVLGLGYCVFLFLGLGFSLSTATGKASLVMKVSILQSVTNIVFSLMLMYWFGFKGVVFGTLISMLCSFIFLTISLNRQLGANLKDFFDRNVIVVLLVNAFAFGCSVFTGAIMQNTLGLETRIVGLITTIIQVFCFVVVFIICQLILKPLYPMEVEALPSRIPFLRTFLKMFTR